MGNFAYKYGISKVYLQKGKKMIRNLVELSEEINGRQHSYSCPSDSPCEEVIAYCKSIIEYCEKKIEEAKAAEEAAKEDEQSEIIEVQDVRCCPV
jgi:hypothetical protein